MSRLNAKPDLYLILAALLNLHTVTQHLAYFDEHIPKLFFANNVMCRLAGYSFECKMVKMCKYISYMHNYRMK